MMERMKAMQKQYANSVLPGVNVSVLIPLNTFCSKDATLLRGYAELAYKRFINLGLCKEETLQTSYVQLAYYGVLMSSLVWGYNLETDEMRLYTCDLSKVKELESRGMLDAKDKDLEALEKRLYGKSSVTKASLKDGSGVLNSACLEPVVVGNSTVFTLRNPRKKLNMNDFVLVPYDTYELMLQLLDGVLQTKVLKVVMGDKTRYLTKNIQVLTRVYGKERTAQLMGYKVNPLTRSFYVPSVGASIYTAGVTNLKLEDIDSLDIITDLSQIDLSDVNTDYTNARDFFIKSLDSIPQKAYGVLAKELETGASKGSVLEAIQDKYDSEIYDLMKKHPEYFDIKKYKSLPPKFGKMKPISVPRSTAELSQLLSTGVFKILSKTRKGKMSTSIVTNNHQCLVKIYGEGYDIKFGSASYRARKALKAYEQCGSVKDMLSVASKLNLPITGTTKEEVINATSEIATTADRVQSPNVVLAKGCEAKVLSDGRVMGWFIPLDVTSIVQISKLE